MPGLCVSKSHLLVWPALSETARHRPCEAKGKFRFNIREKFCRLRGFGFKKTNQLSTFIIITSRVLLSFRLDSAVSPAGCSLQNAKCRRETDLWMDIRAAVTVLVNLYRPKMTVDRNANAPCLHHPARCRLPLPRCPNHHLQGHVAVDRHAHHRFLMQKTEGLGRLQERMRLPRWPRSL